MRQAFSSMIYGIGIVAISFAVQRDGDLLVRVFVCGLIAGLLAVAFDRAIFFQISEPTLLYEAETLMGGILACVVLAYGFKAGAFRLAVAVTTLGLALVIRRIGGKILQPRKDKPLSVISQPR